jgi:uncharacterized membrane protein
MKLAVGSTTTPGTYTITVTGSGSTATHTAAVMLTVPPPDFGISASASTLTIEQGSSGTSTINTTVLRGSPQAVAFSASGQPAGTTVSFSPVSVTAGSSATITVAVGAGAIPGDYTITVTGTAGAVTHTTTVALTVAVASDFSISANPSSLSVSKGDSATSTISTAVTSGTAQRVNLSVAGQPAGVTVSFGFIGFPAGYSTTMTVTVGANTTPGTYTITVTGSGVRATHAAGVTLHVLVPANIVALKSGLSSRTGCTGCDTNVSYGIVLQNTSPDEDARNVTLTVNFLDTNGLIVHASTLSDIGPIPAGATYYYGGGYSENGEGLPVRLEVASAQVTERQPSAIGDFPPVSNVSVTDISGIAHVGGEVTNPYTWTIPDYVDVTAVCFDASGNVIGGGGGKLNASITPGGRTGFDVPIESLTAAQIASVQVSVAPFSTIF